MRRMNRTVETMWRSTTQVSRRLPALAKVGHGAVRRRVGATRAWSAAPADQSDPYDDTTLRQMISELSGRVVAEHEPERAPQPNVRPRPVLAEAPYHAFSPPIVHGLAVSRCVAYYLCSLTDPFQKQELGQAVTFIVPWPNRPLMAGTRPLK